MNYIQEINQFYIRTETNPVSPNAGILWHVLMHVNNRAKWVKEFSVAASVLCAKSGLSPSSFKRARLELKEKGYIRVTSRGTKAPIYQMVSTAAEGVPQDKHQGLAQVADKEALVQAIERTDQVLDQAVSPAVTQEADPLYKQNENKQNKTNQNSNYSHHEIYDFYCANIGSLTDYIQSELNIAIKQFQADLVYEALKRAIENGKASWRYTKGILQKWGKDGVKTMEDVIIVEQRFRKAREAKQGSSGYVSHTKSQEVIPDWFREDRLKKGIIV